MKRVRYKFSVEGGRGRLVACRGRYVSPVVEVGRRYLLMPPRQDGSGWVTGRLVSIEDGGRVVFDSLAGSPFLFFTSPELSEGKLAFTLHQPNRIGLLDGDKFVESGLF